MLATVLNFVYELSLEEKSLFGNNKCSGQCAQHGVDKITGIVQEVYVHSTVGSCHDAGKSEVAGGVGKLRTSYRIGAKALHVGENE